MQESLPILLYDERRLKPALGYVFDPIWVVPEESMFSILWKFGRMNAIPGNALVNYASLRAIDPYEGCELTRETVNVKALAESLHLSQRVLKISLSAKANGPRMSSYLRWCPLCLRRGYHSIIHQFQRVQRCPLHRTVLEMHCPSCHEPAHYRLQINVMNRPYHCYHCGQRYLKGATPFHLLQSLSPNFFLPIAKLRTLYLGM